MTHYSVQPRDQVFANGYEFLSFAKNMGRKIGKNISKSLSSKCSQNMFDHAKQSATDVLKTASKKVIQKTAEATGDLNGNKIADRITKVSKTSPQNNSVTKEENIELEREIHRESYISPEEGQKVLEGLRLI